MKNSEPQQNEALSHDGNDGDVIHLEDYDASVDDEFVRDKLTPYLQDLYKDLLMRSSNSDSIDKVTFIEYTKLPGIINDRIHVMFSENFFRKLEAGLTGHNSPEAHR